VLGLMREHLCDGSCKPVCEGRCRGGWAVLTDARVAREGCTRLADLGASRTSAGATGVIAHLSYDRSEPGAVTEIPLRFDSFHLRFSS
jgi:hypothetical protein